MINILLTALFIAITAIFNTKFNPTYSFITKKIKLNKPPFTCSLCLAFWLAVIYVIGKYDGLDTLFIMPLSAVFAVIIERLIALIPIVLTSKK